MKGIKKVIKIFFKRRSARIVVIITIVVVLLLWQTAIIEIALFTEFDGPRVDNAIALSFDDGPDWGEEALISALNEAGIRVTFFWTWEKIEQIKAVDNERFERILLLIEEGGHEVGIHGYSCCISWNPLDRFFIFNEQEDISVLKEYYYKLLGEVPELYRSHGARSGRQFYKSLKDSGLKLLFGSLVHQISSQKADTLIDHFQSAEGGSIICAHDSKNCSTDYGVATEIAQIVAELGEIAHDRNMEVVTISELLDIEEIPD